MSRPLEPVLTHEDMMSVLANGAPSTSLRPLAARAVALSTALKTIPSELKGEAPTKAANCAPLESLHARWVDRTQATPQTAGEALTTVRRFTELHGTLALREITREHCREFRAAMLRMPRILSEEMRKTPLPDILKLIEGKPYDRINPVTARKRLSFLKTILAFGAEEGDFDESPASGLTIKAGVETEDRKPFSPDDLETLFAALHRRVERDSFYWITVLLLVTGARAGEIIPLETQDIDLDGQTPHIRIVSDATSGRRLKTKHSERSIPLHPALLQLGFAEFVESKEGRLFPELKADKRGKFSTYFSQLWMRWLRTKVGIADRSKTLHSLRHSFKSLSRRAGIPEDVHDAITGHSPATVGRGYGDYPIETLAREMEKIVLPQSLMSSSEQR
jgi:integrase